MLSLILRSKRKRQKEAKAKVDYALRRLRTLKTFTPNDINLALIVLKEVREAL